MNHPMTTKRKKYWALFDGDRLVIARPKRLESWKHLFPTERVVRAYVTPLTPPRKNGRKRNERRIDPTNKPLCELCGEPMPKGEEMFRFHGYSGDCPRPLLKKPAPVPDTPPEIDRKWGKLRAYHSTWCSLFLPKSKVKECDCGLNDDLETVLQERNALWREQAYRLGEAADSLEVRGAFLALITRVEFMTDTVALTEATPGPKGGTDGTDQPAAHPHRAGTQQGSGADPGTQGGQEEAEEAQGRG